MMWNYYYNKYRLGLDMGSTSIGWSVFDLENQCLIACGVRIFDDGREDKSKASLCVKRRNARGARRLNNRRKIKISELIKSLVYMGLFPKEKAEQKKLESLNPYELRAKALDNKLNLHEFGRAIFHLAQRKGFKSNRKDNKAEGGKLLKGYEELKAELEKTGARTYGEFLYKKHLNNPKDNLRLKDTFDDTGKFKGGLFPFREVYQSEFEAIWDKQKHFYPEILTEENKKNLEDIIFFQRPLKEQEEGVCQFEKDEKRIPKAHPLFQEFRIWQNVINLNFAEETSPNYSSLGKEKRDRLIELLQNPITLKPNAQGVIAYSNLKKELGLDKKGLFNFEMKNNVNSDLGKGMIANRTEFAISKSKFFALFWTNFTEEQKGEIINVLARPGAYIIFPKTRLSIEEEDEFIIQYLCEQFGLSEEAAKEFLFEIDFEPDFASLSEKAIRKILPQMKTGMEYSSACKEAGYNHSIKEYAHLDKLPYYGEILSQSCLGKKNNPLSVEEEFGKIGNATVHVALNQIRHLVNELIDLYGKPFDIAIEYARELNASTKERLKMTDTRDKNEVENKKILEELIKIAPGNYNKRDIQKYKIWKKMGIKKGGSPLERECPFSGKLISVSDLLNGQMFQIEHLIPFSRSLDDSLDNKVICSVVANRYKGNRTPFEAFGESKDGYDWKEIQRRAKKLDLEQQWRFSPDAMKKFEERTGPIARSLNDTRYMTRLLQSYLKPIVSEDGKETVQSVVGALTSMVRDSWGLNQYKNKEDEEQYRAFHNHHAIDAIIVSAIDRGQISEVAKQLKTVEKTVCDEFRDEFYKFRDENVSKEEKIELKKRIKDFAISKKSAIINQYIKIPEKMKVPEVLNKVENLNISHKPSLKKIEDKNSTIGKLHEDSAYGLQKFVDDKSLKAIFKFKGEKSEKEVVDYIPMFSKKEDKQEYYDAFRKWFVLDGKSRTMVAKTKEEKFSKNEVAEKERETIQELREASKKAFKWFVGGGNFCAEIYEINPNNKVEKVETNDKGTWKTEIISNYNATIRTERGEDISYWRYKYPNARRVMSLKRNDMVLATFTKEQAYDDKFIKGLQEYVREKFEKDSSLEKVDVLFRVKKMASNGVCLSPHNIAKEVADTKSWISSAEAMKKYQTRKVFLTSAGRIKNAK